MNIIYDKRTGQILYTVENKVENLELPEYQGKIICEEKISVSSHYVELSTGTLTKKNYIELSEENGLLKIKSSTNEDIEVKLLIENSNGFNSIPINLSGFLEITLNNESNLYTKISIFDFKNYSNVLEINKIKIVDIANGISI